MVEVPRRGIGIARRIIRVVSRLVPASRRSEWRQVWEAELAALAGDPRSQPPGVMRFAAGSLPAALSELRAEWGLAALLEDAARAWRRLRGARAHAAFATSIMVVGIGANTSVFTVVNAALFRAPAHISGAGRLVQVGRLKADGDFDNLSYPAYRTLGESTTIFAGAAAYGRTKVLARTPAGTVPLAVHAVTANYFDVLGVTPAAGRSFTDQDEWARAPVVIVSEAFIRRYFAGSGTAIGRTIHLDTVPFTIAGLAPAGFTGVDVAGANPDAWIPLQSYDAALGGGRRLSAQSSWLWVIARLASGVSVDQARAGLEVLGRRLALEHAWADGTTLTLASGVGLKPDERLEAQRVSILLMTIVGVVLLIASINLTGLLVAEAARRRRDLAVCAALGASRLRLTRELLAEQLFIAILAAAGAWALTWWTGRAVHALLPYTLSVTTTPDWRVFAFATAAAVGTSLVVGVWPARRSARLDVVAGLREGAAGVGGRRGHATWLAAAQLALSLALLIGAGLLVRSVLHAKAADPGFEVDTVAAVQMNLDLVRRQSEQQRARTIQQVLDSVGRLPGVRHAAFASHPPLAVPQRTRSLLTSSGDATSRAPVAAVNAITPGYLAALELRLLQGRDFTTHDTVEGAAPVVLVSEATARRMWPDTHAVGQRLDAGRNAEVIGVVGDVRLRSLTDRNQAAIYVPLDANAPSELILVVRSSRDPRALAGEAADVVRKTAPDVVITAARPLRDLLGRTYGETRLVATLLAVFAAIAALMAAAGLYVVLASWVTHRRRELAVRAALGATPGDLRRLVVRHAALPAIAGLVAGAGLAFASSRWLSALLFGVAPFDPLTYAAASVLLLAVSLAAGCLPARRAMKADPIATLKGV